MTNCQREGDCNTPTTCHTMGVCGDAAQFGDFPSADGEHFAPATCAPIDGIGIPDYEQRTLPFTPEERREPTAEDFLDPRFDVLWELLKHLDITGNDIAAILDKLDAVTAYTTSGHDL